MWSSRSGDAWALRVTAAMLALAWYRETGGKGRKDMVVLPYRDRLLLFSRYLQQLVMESLGKEKDLAGNVVHQGIAVYGNKGSTDQHAYVQQLREGVANFFVTFIEVLKDREGSSLLVEDGITSGDFLFGFLQGTRAALHEIAEKLDKVMTELNYVPHAAARHLASRKTSVIGLLLTNIDNEFFAPLVSGIEQVVRQRGYNLLVATYHADNRGSQRILF